MMINDKIALNPYETDIDFMELVSIGDMISANMHGAEYNLTEGRKYRLLAYDGDCIQIENDLGEKDWYSVDYFNKY